MRKNDYLRGITLLSLLSVATFRPAWAVDGVIEINDAVVKKNGGDYPFVITQPGSYRLTGNLNPGQDKSAVRINVTNVTLDLNGFTITGPGGLGTAAGVNGSSSTTVRNGTIMSMPGNGISASGFARIENVRVIANGIGNGMAGMDLGNNASVTGSIASQNGSSGINAGPGSTITGNTVSGNVSSGISLIGEGGCTVTGNTAEGNGTSPNLIPRDGLTAQTAGNTLIGNTARNNKGFGLNLSATSGFANNVLTGNGDGSNGAQRNGGIMMGINICGTAVCQ